ncbi:MAG TPA: urease accessory protein UreD [Vicinamibacterales bacterium]|nr:urease accessory protein UreD [Vicinamibacterales bacterium]
MIATQAAGRATLRFARAGRHTRLAHSQVSAPLAIVRPFDLPDGRLVIQLVTLGPGLCGGDAVHVDVAVDEGAALVLTTTAATRVMSMSPGDRASQHVALRAGPGASLEYYPAPAIPFPGSALTQSLTIDADESARVAVVESWALGRSARGEYLQFRSLSSRTRFTTGGTLLYADALQLEPAEHDVANAGILDGRRYLAAGFFTGVDAIAAPDPHPDAALAMSRPGLAYLRVLADDAPALDAAVQRSLERVALAWNRPAVRFDRFRC